MASISTEEPPAQITLPSGPGTRFQKTLKYTYLEGVLYLSGIKRDSAAEIRNRLRHYHDPKNPVSMKYMLAQYMLWGCSSHCLNENTQKDVIRKKLIQALNDG
jgi:hypothetical protein